MTANNVLRLPTYAERKATGDVLESRVRTELELRGWTVSEYGQAVLAEPIRDALKRTECRMRWDPEFVASLGSYLCLVDAKGSMQGEDAWTYTISRKALRAHLKLAVDLDLPIYYVFANLGVATPTEVMQFCRLARVGDAGGYVSFGAGLPRPFDDVFGVPTALAA
jgi:hypothetical protein